MKLVTADYKNAIVQPRRIDAKIIKDDTTITIDNINNITLSFNSSLFKSIMKTLTLDTNNSFNVGIVNPQIGIYTNEEFEYISLEKFKLIKTERNQDTLSYESKCYDKIIESMIDFDLDVTYPIKVRDYWIAIYNKLGWNISGIPETFINSEKYIKKDVHSKIGYTYRDVIDELCTISCAFLVDKNGIPTISYPYDTNEIIDEEYMDDVSVKIGNKIFFNSLVFSRVEESDNIFRKDEESISTYGLKEFKVSDNQLLSTNDREDYIDEMWEYIKNFEYYSFDIKTRGITFLDPIDKFSIKIGTNVYPTILLNDDLQICDGIFETIYNDEIKETTTEYKYAAETDKRINQTYMMVDKQKGIITSVVNSAETISKGLNDTNQKLEDGLSNINSDLSNYQQTMESKFEQTNNQFNIGLSVLTETIDAKDEATNNRINEINNYIRYALENNVGVVTIGTSDSPIKLKVKNDRISFEQNNREVAYISNNTLYITDATFLNSMRIGNFAFIPRTNGSLGFKKVI